MSFSTPFYSEKPWVPCVFLHGLGSQTHLDPSLEKVLSDIWLSISSLLRDDQSILAQENPQDIYLQEVSTLVEVLSKRTQQKIVLIGNSLGSYIALLIALHTSEKIQAVLWLDAFLTPKHGFTQMRDSSLRLDTQLKDIPEEALSDFWRKYKSKSDAKKEGTFIVPLVDGFIEIPSSILEKFQDIWELRSARDISFPVGLMYSRYDSFIISSHPPESLIRGQNISHFEIQSVKDVPDWKKRNALHNDWKNSPEAISFALNFLKNVI